MAEANEADITARSRAIMAADRARDQAADEAAARHRRSIIGRVERVARWLRNPRTGPVARLRRVARVLVDIGRSPRALPELPRAVLAAARAPSVFTGVIPPRPPRPVGPDRAAALERLVAFDAAERAAARPLRVALIADMGLTEDIARAATIVPIHPEDWRTVLAADPPDVLLVESAWRGNDGAWQYRIAWYAHPDSLLHRDLRALLAWCADHAVPTIFWDTAGDAGVPRFRDVAVLFDVIISSGRAAARYAAFTDRRGAGVIAPGNVAEGPAAPDAFAVRLQAGLATDLAAAA